MSKKIMLLVLAAISTGAFALPSTSMAEDVPLHLIPKPEKETVIKSSGVTKLDLGGFVALCESTVGNAIWESSTTGTMNLTIKGCQFVVGGSCQPAEAKGLPFHLVTLPGLKPGILITAPGQIWFKLVCPTVGFNVGGNGLIGTITSPGCFGESSAATIKFESAETKQKHTKVEGTETEYHLTLNEAGEPNASLETELTMTFEGKKKLECT
ncbi:MAG: hypothetical protein ACTHKT_04090 [Solirubrobacterales bacterium]